MDIIKKNLLSIICGVVALLAIAAYFVFVGSKRDELEKTVSSRVQVYRSIDDLRTKQRNIPIIMLQDTEQRPLEQFPTRPVIDKAKGVQDQMKKEADQTLSAALKLNQHKLLMEGALPGVRELDRYNYRFYYRARLGLDPQAAQTYKIQSIQEEIGGGSPPTQQQVDRIADELWRTDYEPKVPEVAGRRDDVEFRRQWQEQKDKLPEQLIQKAAKESKVYLAEGAFDYYPSMVQGDRPPTQAEIWWAQVGLWVQEDVARAIARLNAKAADVTEAPVKQLLKVEQPKQFHVPGSAMVGLVAGGAAAAGGGSAAASPAMSAASERQRMMEEDRRMQQEERRMRMMEMGGPGGGPGGPGGPPAPPPPSGGAAAGPGNTAASQPPGPPVATASPTGRVCNSLYDVLHFTVRMDVEAAQVPAVLAELARNQFIYVLATQVDPLDTTLVSTQGYRYGDKPVVRLTLVCEELFLRKWTVPLMPDDIRLLVGAPAPGAAADAAVR